jgi:hypothetical protein
MNRTVPKPNKAKARPLPRKGANRNLTLLGKIARDSDAWEIVQRAEKIYEQWQREDREAAIAARAEAEARLAKLEAASA